MVVNIMVIQLRERSQVTLPAEIVKKLDLKAGDNLEITLELEFFEEHEAN